MKSSSFVSDCGCGGNCGGSSLHDTPASTTSTEKDTIEQAKQFSNAEIPMYMKVLGGIAVYAIIVRLSKSKSMKKKS